MFKVLNWLRFFINTVFFNLSSLLKLFFGLISLFYQFIQEKMGGSIFSRTILEQIYFFCLLITMLWNAKILYQHLKLDFNKMHIQLSFYSFYFPNITRYVLLKHIPKLSYWFFILSETSLNKKTLFI